MTTTAEMSPTAAAQADESDVRRLAIKRLKKKRAFKSHLFTYLVVNAALWTIWAIDGVRNDFGWPWPAIVTFFWGLFVLGDANDTFWKRPISEHEIEREVERITGSDRSTS